MKTFLKLSLLAFALTSRPLQAEIPVLSVDELGNEVTTMISEEDFTKITSLQADAFAQTAKDHVAAASLAPHLTLKGILIGLEAQGSVGPTPMKIGAGINQQFYFEIKN